MKQILRSPLLFAGLLLLSLTGQSQTNYTWNGTLSGDWNTAANWTPNGIPGVADNVTIVTGSNPCLLNCNMDIANFKLTSGTLDLGGFTFTVNGTTATFSLGTVQNGTMTIPAATTTSFGNGPINMNCIVNITSAAVTMKNTSFQKVLTITKTGSSNDASGGNNVFNDVSAITNAGSGYLVLANGQPDIFHAPVTFNNTGSNHIYVAYNSINNVFGDSVTFNNTPSANTLIYVGQNSAGTVFNGNIVVSSNSGQGVQFCGGTSASAILAAGKNISVGAGGFTAGTLLLRQFTQTGATAQNLVLTGSGNLTIASATVFNGDLTISSPTLYLNGGTFNGATDITKTGSTGDWSTGGNTFNGVCSLTNSGSSYLLLGSTNPDTWNNDVTFTNNGSERLLPCWSSIGNRFNGNIYVNTAGSAQGIQFCGGNTTATAILAVNKTLQTGTGGLTTGYLQLKQFTQLGNAPINLTGTCTLDLGPGSTFGGPFTATASDIWVQGATYNGPATFTKTGGSSNHNNQYQNIFNASCTINQQSNTGYFMLGYNSNDQFNDSVIVTSTGTGGIYLGWTSGTGTPTLAAGKPLLVGNAGFNAGFLNLNTFAQLGNAPVSLNFTGATTLFKIARNSVIGGNLAVVSPRILLNGAVYNGTVNVTKTGATGEWSSGGNIFNDTLTVNQQGAGYFGFASGAPDIYNGDVYVNNNSTERVIFGNGPTGNRFNGNIILTQIGSSTGIAFGWNSNTDITLAAGKTISIGQAGFNTGYLQIERFTQLGNEPVNLPLTGTSSLVFGPTSTIGGNLLSTSGSLYFNGCTFNGTVNSTKTGATNDASSGNNIFNGAFSITNTGAGYFLMGNGNPDTWQSTAIFNNQSTAQHMYVAYNSTGNVFNGDVSFNNQPGNTGLWIYANNAGINTRFNGNITVTNANGAGVYFGNGSGNATLSSGHTIGVDAAGFTAGGLILRNFIQSGSSATQTLTMTGSSYLQYGPGSSFDAAVSSSSPGLFFNGSVFNGPVNATKTGTSSDQSTGNNLFNNSALFTNTGTGYLLLTNNTADAYNGDVSFVQSNTGVIYPNYNNNSVYSGNLTVTSPSATAMTFGAGNGTATLSGSALQNINAGAGTPSPVFTRLAIANTGGVTLNTTSINVSKSLTMTSGLLNTTTTRILTMLNGSVTASGDALSTSYVNGPMRYQKSSSGATTMNFPVGNAPDCRPIVLTVSHSNGNLYTYQVQLFNSSALALGYSFPASVDHVSDIHYYTIGRTDASGTNQPVSGLSGTQTIQLFFGANDIVSNGTSLTVVKNTYLAPASWIDIGGMNGPVYNAGDMLTGSVTSSSGPSPFNSFSTFALGDKLGGGNTLPVGLLDFHARTDNGSGGVDLSWTTATETNNSYFTVEKSADAVNFVSVQKVLTAAVNGTSAVPLDYTGYDAHPYNGVSYYRLKQTDLDGKEHYSAIQSVNFVKKDPLSVYPNPTRGPITITGIGAEQTTIKVEWFDIGGRLVWEETLSAQNGRAVSNTHLNNGMYGVKVQTPNGNSWFQQILVLK